MPKLVDHAERHREITDAVRRVIARDGLPAATFQSVAAEAGVSVRLVQYYFGNKRELLLATQRALIDDAGARFADRWSQLGVDFDPRAAIQAVLLELLPLTEARRADAIVLVGFHTIALTERTDDSTLDAESTLDAPLALTSLVEAQLARIAAAEPLRGIDPKRDADLLVIATAGLSQGMLAGLYTGEAAHDLVERLLDRVLGPR